MPKQNLIQCCRCYKHYELVLRKGDDPVQPVLVCPHCGFSHVVSFKALSTDLTTPPPLDTIALGGTADPVIPASRILNEDLSSASSGDNADVIDWATTDNFVVCIQLDEQKGPWTTTYKLRWRNVTDSGVFADVAATGQIKIASNTTYMNDGDTIAEVDAKCTNDPGGTWTPGEEVEGDNITGSITMADETYTELWFAVSPADALTEKQYEFELYDNGNSASVGTCLAQVTTAAVSAPVNITMGSPAALTLTGQSLSVSNDADITMGSPAALTLTGQSLSVVNESYDFVMTIQTVGTDDTFTLPTDDGHTYNCTVYWGDESSSEITAYNDPDITHTYATEGSYEIRIRGTFERIYFNLHPDVLMVTSIDQWGDTGLLTLGNAFVGCSNATFDSSDYPDTSGMTGFYAAFQFCDLFNPSWISSIDTSSALLMQGMFEGCTAFNRSLANFDVSSVTNMSAMFEDCVAFNSSLAGWTTTALTNCADMFEGASVFNQDISGWDVDLVTTFEDMFKDALAFSQDLSSWSVSSQCTTLEQMFDGATSFVSFDMSGWDVSSVTSMILFLDGQTLTTAHYDATLAAWSLLTVQSGVTCDMGSSEFSDGDARIILDITNTWTITDGGISATEDAFRFWWNTTITTFTLPAASASNSFYVDWGDGSGLEYVSSASPTHAYGSAVPRLVKIAGTCPEWYFNNGGDCASVTSVLDLGDVGWTSLDGSFRGCSGMTAFNFGSSDLSSIGTLSSMFNGCTSLAGVTLSGFDASGVTNMDAMFQNCSSLVILDLSSWDVSNVSYLHWMFNGCTSLATFNISGWVTTSNVSTAAMFQGCSSLTSIDVTFDVSSVGNMSQMFRGCSSLTTIDVSGWVTSSATNMSEMFEDCTVLNVDVSGFDIADVTVMTEMFNGSAFSDANYDLLLVAWEAQIYQTNVVFHAGTAKHSPDAPATAKAALITDGWTITDGGLGVPITAGSITLSGQNLTVLNAQDIDIEVPAGSLTLAGQSMSVKEGINISAASMTLAGQNLTLTIPNDVQVPAGSLTLAGQDLYVEAPSYLEIASASNTYAGFAPKVNKDITLGAPASLSLIGQNLEVDLPVDLDIAAASLTLAGQNLEITTAKDIFIASASMTLAGQSLIVENDSVLDIGKADITLSGQALDSVDRSINMSAGSMSLLGYAPDITKPIGIPAGSLDFTGQSLAVHHNQRINIAAASLSFTGFLIDPKVDLRVRPGAAALLLSGQALEVRHNNKIQISNATNTLSGQDLFCGITTNIPVPKGDMILTGQDLTIDIGASMANRLAIKTGTFVDADLDGSDILTITHNLNASAVHVTITDDADEQVHDLPTDQISVNALEIDFTSISPISGTYKYRVSL